MSPALFDIRRVSSAIFSRRSLFVAPMICLFLVGLAKADKIKPTGEADDDRAEKKFWLADVKHSNEFRREVFDVSHVFDEEGFSRKLKFIVGKPHYSDGTNLGRENFWFRDGASFGTRKLQTKSDDPISSVPEPSSLFLLAGGLLGLGRMLRNRIAKT